MIRTQLKYLVIISVVLPLLGQASFADSLWPTSQVPFYGVPKKIVRVGDVITIFISESTSAVQEATTRTAKDSNMGTNFLSGWDQVANLAGNETIRKTYDFEFAGNDKYAGSGQTTRKSQVNAVVTAVVTEILENGNLFVVGQHKVKVNNEVQTIRVSGIIQPSDIAPNNSVLSSQIAKAEVSVNGAGVVGIKQSPGIMTKMFNWLF